MGKNYKEKFLNGKNFKVKGMYLHMFIPENCKYLQRECSGIFLFYGKICTYICTYVQVRYTIYNIMCMLYIIHILITYNNT